MTHQELPSYDQAPAGALRFNTDSRKLEVYTGGPVGYGTLPNGQWMQVDSFTPDIATGGARGVFAGGLSPALRNHQDYINVATTGNALSFGSLTRATRGVSGLASRTRGIFAGGYDPGYVNTIEFVTIASTGSNADFGGDLTITSFKSATLSNSTRGIIAQMESNTPTVSPTNNVINYMNIASQGVDAQDFGDTTTNIRNGQGLASSTRGVMLGGYNGSNNTNTIQFITISTLGNAADFGDLTEIATSNCASSNSIRGINASGIGGPATAANNVINYITISTLGNAIDFGDLTRNMRGAAPASSSTRSVFAGGIDPAGVDVIDYVQIMSTGNAVDFGNLTVARGQNAGCSNGHGGL